MDGRVRVSIKTWAAVEDGLVVAYGINQLEHHLMRLHSIAQRESGGKILFHEGLELGEEEVVNFVLQSFLLLGCLRTLYTSSFTLLQWGLRRGSCQRRAS